MPRFNAMSFVIIIGASLILVLAALLAPEWATSSTGYGLYFLAALLLIPYHIVRSVINGIKEKTPADEKPFHWLTASVGVICIGVLTATFMGADQVMAGARLLVLGICGLAALGIAVPGGVIALRNHGEISAEDV